MTEAPVVIVFCRMEPDGRYNLEFRQFFFVPKDAPSNGDTGRWVQHFIEILEGEVRRSPTNSNDYFFWNKADGLVA
jgi:lauroyl/myristoyl acyltransferase